MSEILQIISEGWFTNLLGILGGILGMWTFIDSYLIPFSPRIYIGTSIIADTAENKFPATLDAIFVSLELCNHRKKYGIVYDLAVRIYKTNAINPINCIYYASQLVGEMPIDANELQNGHYQLFSPITLAPQSNRSVNLVLGDVLYTSKMHLAKTENYYIEVYYQKKPEGKWIFIDKLYLLNKDELKASGSRYVQFLVLKSSQTREKLNKRIIPQKTSMYLGASHQQLSFRIKKIKSQVFKKTLGRLRDAVYAIPLYTRFLADFLMDKFIKIPIIKKYGKNIKEMKITFGSPDSRALTEKAFQQIYKELQGLVSSFNERAEEKAKTSLDLEGRYIVLSRHKLQIRIYISGDQNITVQAMGEHYSSRMNYSLNLRKALWDREYWKLENYGFIRLKSFAVKVLDAFIFHSAF